MLRIPALLLICLLSAGISSGEYYALIITGDDADGQGLGDKSWNGSEPNPSFREYFSETLSVPGVIRPASNHSSNFVSILFHVGFTVHPNPCNPTAVLRFDLPQAAGTSLEVFDIRGRKVQTVGFSESDLRAGLHEVPFDGTDLPSGVYLCRLQAAGTTFTRKLTLLK